MIHSEFVSPKYIAEHCHDFHKALYKTLHRKIINRSRINVCKQLLMSDLFSNFDHDEFYIQAYGYCIQYSFIVALQ